MATKIDTTSQKREAIRLMRDTELSNRKIAILTGLSHTLINAARKRYKQFTGSFTDVEKMPDTRLRHLLDYRENPSTNEKLMPDFTALAKHGKKENLNKEELYLLYRRAAGKHAYSSSRFYELFRLFEQKSKLSMLMHYQPGDILFVDFCGKRPELTCPDTGKKTKVEVFVAVLGYSGKAFTFACRSQSAECFVEAMIKVFEYLGGVPKIVCPDNLKAAITKAGNAFVVNKLFQELSYHYDFIIQPARVAMPQDKARAENHVRLVNENITRELLKMTFFDLDEMNKTISLLNEMLNNKPFQQYDGCRNSWFESGERQALKLLPIEPFPVVLWRGKQKVPSTYHIIYNGHFYSVPCKLKGEKVEVTVTTTHVSCYFDNERVAHHKISYEQRNHTTKKEHMPPSHRAYAKLTKSYFLTWANGVGHSTLVLMSKLFDNVPECSVGAKRNGQKIMRLASDHGLERLENACAMANDKQSVDIKYLTNVLKHGLDKVDSKLSHVPDVHFISENARGAQAFLGRRS